MLSKMLRFVSIGVLLVGCGSDGPAATPTTAPTSVAPTDPATTVGNTVVGNTVVGATVVGVAVVGTPSLPPDTLIGFDALLGPLAYNGGPTRTHSLLAGSPAIDAGNNVANEENDQRGPGFPRVIGARADIGALEYSDAIFVDGFELD